MLYLKFTISQKHHLMK